MTIIVGRGRSKATQRIDISDPTVSREHCWLTDNGDGTYTLLNKSQQGTVVNGNQVVKTRVTPDTLITLSPTTTVRVADLLPLKQPKSPEQPVRPAPQNPAPPKEYSIEPLKAVWEDYHNTLLDIQLRQRKINLWRSASPMFTIGSGALATLAKTMGWSDAIFTITSVMTGMGLLLMAYCFYKGFTDNSIKEKEEATEKFTRRYICPNPKCRHFMGNQSYTIVKQNKCCPWCKSKFVD